MNYSKPVQVLLYTNIPTLLLTYFLPNQIAVFRCYKLVRISIFSSSISWKSILIYIDFRWETRRWLCWYRRIRSSKARNSWSGWVTIDTLRYKFLLYSSFIYRENDLIFFSKNCTSWLVLIHHAVFWCMVHQVCNFHKSRDKWTILSSDNKGCGKTMLAKAVARHTTGKCECVRWLFSLNRFLFKLPLSESLVLNSFKNIWVKVLEWFVMFFVWPKVELEHEKQYGDSNEIVSFEIREFTSYYFHRWNRCYCNETFRRSNRRFVFSIDENCLNESLFQPIVKFNEFSWNCSIRWTVSIKVSTSR